MVRLGRGRADHLTDVARLRAMGEQGADLWRVDENGQAPMDHLFASLRRARADADRLTPVSGVPEFKARLLPVFDLAAEVLVEAWLAQAPVSRLPERTFEQLLVLLGPRTTRRLGAALGVKVPSSALDPKQALAGIALRVLLQRAMGVHRAEDALASNTPPLAPSRASPRL